MTSVASPRAQPELTRCTCSACGAAHPGSEALWRCDCNGVLDVDLPAVSLENIDHRRSGVWRYASLLTPLAAAARVTLGEQTTPLIHNDILGAYLKLDYLPPSGSCTDRRAAALVSRLHSQGVNDTALDSTGNADAAMPAYGAAAGIECQAFVPARNS
jgi:threonine synthase